MIRPITKRRISKRGLKAYVAYDDNFVTHDEGISKRGLKVLYNNCEKDVGPWVVGISKRGLKVLAKLVDMLRQRLESQKED